MRIFVGMAGLFLFSQNLIAQPVTLGVKAGMNASWHHSGEHYKEPRGLTAGVTSSLPVVGPLSLQAELLYAAKGASFPYQYDMRLHYLELPLLVRFSPFTASRIRPVLMLGGAPAVELSCSGHDVVPISGAGGGLPSASSYYAPTQNVPIQCQRHRGSKYDMGLTGALGAEIQSERVTWTVEARFTGGLKNVGAVNGSERNRSLAILFGFRGAKQGIK